MPTLLTIALSIGAGVAISAGLSALFVALRRQQPTLQLLFAVMCLLIALNDFVQLRLYHSAGIESHLPLFKTQVTLSIMIGVIMLWFTSRYTGGGQSRWLLIWTALGVILIMLNSLMPYSIIYSAIRRVDGTTLRWGEQVFITDGAPSPAVLALALFSVGVFIYTIYGCAQHYLHARKREAINLGLIGILLGVTHIHDLAMHALGYKTLSLYDLGVFGLVAVLSTGFSDEIITAETDLRNYQDHLQTLVDERTIELRNTNALLAREVAVRKQAEESLQSRLRDLNTLNRISHTVADVTDLPRALEMVAEQVKALFGATACYMYSADLQISQIPSLQECMRRHDIRRLLAPNVMVLDVPAIRHAATHGESVVIEDTALDDRVKDKRNHLLTRGVRSLMLAPLKARGEVIGCIGVSSEDAARRFSSSELSLFENIAGDIASALENARLYTQAQTTAVGIERQRLARELHDSVTQSLFSLTLLADGWGTLSRDGKLADIPGSFRQLGEVGQQALKEMRLLIHQLRPPILEEAGLVGALRQRLEAVERRVNVQTRLNAEGDIDSLSLDVQEQLFHIAQEALNNSLRYADASVIAIEIDFDTKELHSLIMTIEDDGIGYDPKTAIIGMGTRTMQERAAQIGGAAIVRTAPGAGTTVEVVLHMDAQHVL